MDRGISYPKLPVRGHPSTNHLDFAHSFANASKRISAEESAVLAKEWNDESTKNGNRVLLSAESLWRHVLAKEGAETYMQQRDAYLARVANALSDFEVEVVLVFRHPDPFIRSFVFGNDHPWELAANFQEVSGGQT